MSEIKTRLLAYVFSAFLPPNDPEERDFYEVLGISQDATNEQIRKAYKSKSLQLHPDKVAQRRGNLEESAKEYELVQEAYAVLVQDEKRQRYHALSCSPTRYRFVQRGALVNPGALYENLTHAQVAEKTRLVMFCTLLVIIVMIQPILIATKVNHIVEQSGALEDSKWMIVLLPTWILGGLWLLFWLFLLAITPTDAKITILITFLENFSWYLGVFFLARKWDHAWTSDYSKVLIPIYFAMIFRWLGSMALLYKIGTDVERMVTVEFLEREILQGKPLDSFPEEEQERIRTQYLVVTVPPEFIPIIPEGMENDEIDEHELETQKVESTPEYDMAMQIYSRTMSNLIGSVVFGIAFLVVLTSKLDGNIDASYWVIFTPVWVHYGSRWFASCFKCVFMPLTEEEIALQMQMEEAEAQQEAEGSTTEEKKDETSETPAEQATEEKTSEGDKPAVSSATDTLSKDNDIENGTSTAKQETTGSTDTPSTENAATETAKATEPETSASSGNGVEMDDDSNINIDEDTFRAWQNAYEEAEKGAMEQQAEAGQTCISLSFELALIVMIVAKVDQAYDSEDPDDVGFNTFWILFPFFLFFGLLLCCCACMIYGAEPGSATEFEGDEASPEVDEESPAASPEEPTIIAPVVVPETKIEEPETIVEQKVEPPAPKEPEAVPDMDDLD
eukprot:Nitzschia sp. Nitz4//scaffold144_size56818//28793//30820//NITZ4_006537-RA/size56818-processed-gene-0.84-mRNA-1//-1//CDS//3329536516//771//frame0